VCHSPADAHIQRTLLSLTKAKTERGLRARHYWCGLKPLLLARVRQGGFQWTEEGGERPVDGLFNRSEPEDAWVPGGREKITKRSIPKGLALLTSQGSAPQCPRGPIQAPNTGDLMWSRLTERMRGFWGEGNSERIPQNATELTRVDSDYGCIGLQRKRGMRKIEISGVGTLHHISKWLISTRVAAEQIKLNLLENTHVLAFARSLPQTCLTSTCLTSTCLTRIVCATLGKCTAFIKEHEGRRIMNYTWLLVLAA